MSNHTNYYADGSTIYQAEDFRAPWAALLTNGTIGGYAVSADSPADLGVSVSAGVANINGYISRDDAAVMVAIGANTSGYNRIDLIVIDIDTTNNVTTLKAVQGVPSSSPVAPAVTSNQTALAQVLVGNNASVINSNVITDKRVLAACNPPAQSTTKDYIAESGDNTYWRWRKWASGVAECWRVRTCTNINCTTAWGSMYETADTYGPEGYPFAFAEAPLQLVDTKVVSGGAVFVEPMSNSATSTGQWSFYRPVSTSDITAAVYFYVIGRWK